MGKLGAYLRKPVHPCEIEGEALPVNDVEIVSGRIPAQIPKGDFNTSFTIRNIGVNPLTPVGYVCKVGDNEVEKRIFIPDAY